MRKGSLSEYRMHLTEAHRLAPQPAFLLLLQLNLHHARLESDYRIRTEGKDKKGKRRANRTTLGRDGVLERSEHACHAAANARLRSD